MKRIEATIVDNPFPPDFMKKLIDEFERVMAMCDIMHVKECADYLGYSVAMVNRLTKAGVLPYHTLPGLEGKLYLRSEIIETIKGSKRK